MLSPAGKRNIPVFISLIVSPPGPPYLPLTRSLTRRGALPGRMLPKVGFGQRNKEWGAQAVVAAVLVLCPSVILNFPAAEPVRGCKIGLSSARSVLEAGSRLRHGTVAKVKPWQLC